MNIGLRYRVNYLHGWARSFISFYQHTDSDSSKDLEEVFKIGSYGDTNGYYYSYIGGDSYDGNNLRFYKDGSVRIGNKTIYHEGNLDLSSVNAKSLSGYYINSFIKSGENLIKGSSCASTSGWDSTGWSGGQEAYDAASGIYNFYSLNGWRSFYYKLPDEYASKQISFSFDIMYVSSESTELSPLYIGTAATIAGGDSYGGSSVTDVWVHKSGVRTLSSTPYFTVCIRGTDNQNKKCLYRIRNLKVELGDLSTIWTPSPSDIPVSISTSEIDTIMV